MANVFDRNRWLSPYLSPAGAGIPIIAMTANVFQEDVQAARNAGMDGHIAKPLDVEKMLSTLTQVLSKRHG